MAPPEDSVVLDDGPWTHRQVSANGIRLHVVECGTGPLVLLLHGFPQFWWAWREHLTILSGTGFRAVAVDLRGYGASDKPPRGYDPFTAADDIAGLIRALGERDAALVAHGWGGVLAWCTTVLHAPLIRRLVVMGTAHPLRQRMATLTEPRGQFAASRVLLGFQLPWRPEHWLVDDDAANVGALLHRWGGPDYPSPEVEHRYRQAMRIPGVAHCSLEYYRWFARSQLRSDGRRFARLIREPIATPTLQIHGAMDSAILPGTAAGSGRYVSGPYDWRLVSGAGHFVHEERTAEVGKLVADWIAS